MKASRGRPTLGPTLNGFALDCECGRPIPVLASHAGSTIRCVCGTDVNVPSLGRLRELAGQNRYESSVNDTIRRMIESGELPAGNTCAVSNQPTTDVIDLEILVPRHFKTNDEIDRVAVFFLGLVAAMLLTLFQRSKYVEEESTKVCVPLLVAQRCQEKVRGMSQHRVRRLLQTVPISAQLLEENPESVIKVLGFLD